MSGQLAAPDTVDLAQFRGGEGAAHLPGVHLASHRFEVLAHGLGRADVLQDDALEAALVHIVAAHQGDEEVGGDEAALLVHEDHAVRISVVDDAGVGLYFPDKVLEGNHVRFDQRVGLMVRETAVHRVE